MNVAGSSDDPVVEATPVDSPEPAPESLTPGELLRRERERRSITKLHIAEELHLDLRIVEAIEANRFDELGVPVYARGHLRQYATLLGLSPQFVIQRYEAVTGRQEILAPLPASISVGSSALGERRSFAGPLWSALGLLALVLGWWIWSTVSKPGDPMESTVSDQAIEAESGGNPAPAPAFVDTPEPVAGVTQPATPPTAASSATTATAPAAGELRVKLEFSDASWTEIYDASGKRLMFGLGESGKARTVTGSPPLRVTLGNASAVTVLVNDRPIVVPRRAGKDAAKFTIAAGGAVQMTSGEVPVE